MEGDKTEMRKLKMGLILVILVFSGARISSCSTPKVMPKAEVVEMPTDDLREGRNLFNSHCSSCHPAGKAGLAPGIIDKPLPEFLIRFQIRHGVGVMPAFDEEVLSDQEVEKIAEYLVYLRKENRN